MNGSGNGTATYYPQVLKQGLRTVNKLVDGLARRGYRRGHESLAAMPSVSARALDAVFDALANERRREIVARLARGSMTTPEIGRHFGFSKQALSRHVGQLESAGLVSRTLRGRVHELALVPRRLDRVERWVCELRRGRGWTASLDRLDEVLRARKD